MGHFPTSFVHLSMALMTRMIEHNYGFRNCVLQHGLDDIKQAGRILGIIKKMV